uniref:dolichyl-phosphate-mannose--protein mannosyltransferase n=1 Tax=Cacopsylla melanoneura TaxID=428564 RepID=A0A8D8WH46_9HEMI
MMPWTLVGGLSVIVAFCVYYNSLNAGFVYDDSRVIVSNPDILPSTPVETIFRNDFWGTPIKSPSSHGSYRPLCVLTFRLNYLWSGLKPAAYHLVNVTLHCLCTYLVHLLAGSILPSKKASWVASGLFAVHPIHTEAVSGLVGRADILSCIFYVLAILGYVHLPPRSTLRYFMVTVLGACAMLSKEIGVSAVLICIVWDIVCSARGSNSGKTKKSWKSSILLTLSFISLLCVRIMIMGDTSPSFSKADNPTARHSSFVTRTLTFLYLPILNLKLLVYPQTLSYDWGMESIPQINDIYDCRNLLTILFYGLLSYTSIDLIRFLIKNDNRQPKKPLTSRLYKNCDNLEIMCNYCRYRRRCEEPSNNHQKVEIDLNNNVMGDNYEVNYMESGKAFDTRSNVSSKCFNYESVVEQFIKKLCLSLMNVYMKNQENIAFQSRKPSFNVIHEPSYKNETKPNSNERYLENMRNRFPVNSKKEQTDIDEERTIKKKVQTSVHTPSGSKETKCSCKTKSGPFNNISMTVLKHEERLAVMLALLVIPFIPASNLFFYVGFVLAERVLYIPSVGYCYLVAYAYSVLLEKSKGRKKLLNILVICLMVIYALKTVRRNNDWLNEENLYRSGIPVNPPKSYGNLGSILSSQRRFSEAEEAYRMALKHRPNMADVHYNLGILLQGQQRTEEAIASYKKAIFYRPSLALAYLNLGQLLASIGQSDMAASMFRQCASLDGTGLKDPRTHEVAKITALLHLGRLHGDKKQYTEAATVYREALHRMPPYYQPSMLYSLLGEALTHLSRHNDAEDMYKAALRAQPDHVASHLTYGKLLAKNRTRLSEAELWFQKAQKLAPDDPNVYQHYGQFLSEQGRNQEAVLLYTKAVQLSPNDYDSTVGAATALRHCNRLDEAEEYYRRATKLRPLDAGSHSNLGAILHLNRKLAEAEASYSESIRLQPQDNTARQNLKKLKALRSNNNSS